MSGQINIYQNFQVCNPEDLHLSTHERIGSLYHRLVNLLDQAAEVSSGAGLAGKQEDYRREINQILQVLGVHVQDGQAQEFFIDFFYQLKEGKVKLISSSETEGMYFLEVDGVKKWVFKPGEKRAYIETLARKVALLAGLEKHIPEGIYCSLKLPGEASQKKRLEEVESESDTEEVENKAEDDDDGWDRASAGSFSKDWSDQDFGFDGIPSTSALLSGNFSIGASRANKESDNDEQNPILIELFNGLVKQVYPEKGGFLTGILERFEAGKTDLTDPVRVSNMAILMSIIGLRDTSSDNVKGDGVFIDAEDSFPLPNGDERLDETALFELEFLVDGNEANPVLEKPLRAEHLTFRKIKPTESMSLMQEKILFFDALAERELKVILVCEKTGEEEEVTIIADEEKRLSFKTKTQKFQELIDKITLGSTEAIPLGWHFKKVGSDSAGNTVALEIPVRHAISGYITYLDQETQLPSMPSGIIDGVIERTGSLKTFINGALRRSEHDITALDLLKAADKRFAWQVVASPQHMRHSLTESDFYGLFPNEPEKAKIAYERYRRAPTPFNVIGRGPSRNFGLMSLFRSEES